MKTVNFPTSVAKILRAYETDWKALLVKPSADGDSGKADMADLDCQKIGKKYYVSRLALAFDTSMIPSSATIISASLNFFIEGSINYEAGDCPIHVLTYNKIDTNNLQSEDFNPLKWGITSLGSKKVSRFLRHSLNTINLNAKGCAAITKGGITKLGLRYQADIDGIPAPTDTRYLRNIRLYEGTYHKKPYLTIRWFGNADNQGERYQGDICYSRKGYERNSGITLVQFPDIWKKKIWAIWMRGGRKEDGSREIVRAEATGNGTEWKKPVTLVKDPTKMLLGSGILKGKPTVSDLVLFWNRIITNWDEGKGKSETWYKISKNGGAIWGENRQIPPSIIPRGDWYTNCGIPLVKQHAPHAGRIILPVAKLGGRKLVHFHSVALYHFHSLVLYTDDSNLTPHRWQKGNEIIFATNHNLGTDEVTVIEKDNGDLVGFLRTELGRIHRTISKDGGVNWSNPSPTTLKSPSSLPRVDKIDNKLVCMFNHDWPGPDLYYPRRNMAMAVSDDWGETWRGIKYFRSLANIAGWISNGSFIQSDTGDILAANEIYLARRNVSEAVFDRFNKNYLFENADGDFEWDNTYPLPWSCNENQLYGWHNENGCPVTSNEQVRTGTRSLKISPKSSTQSVRAGIVYPGATRNVKITGWFNDTVGQTMNYQTTYIAIGDDADGSTMGTEFRLGIHKSGRTGSGNYYSYYDGSWRITSVRRSIGWHSFELLVNPRGVTAKIDGKIVTTNNKRLTNAWTIQIYGSPDGVPLTTYWNSIKIDPNI